MGSLLSATHTLPGIMGQSPLGHSHPSRMRFLMLICMFFLSSVFAMKDGQGNPMTDEKFDELIEHMNKLATSYNKFVENYKESLLEQQAAFQEAAVKEARRKRRMRRM